MDEKGTHVRMMYQLPVKHRLHVGVLIINRMHTSAHARTYARKHRHTHIHRHTRPHTPEDVADAGHAGLVHEDLPDGLGGGLHAIPEALLVCGWGHACVLTAWGREELQ